MDTRDRLDLLLERSAPTPLRVDDELERAMDQVTYAARAQVAAEQPRAIRRTPHLVAGIGLAVLLTGGAGAAVAAGGFEWLPWAQDPDAAYVFTLPSGRDCELRVVVEQTEDAGDWNAFVTDVGHLTVEDTAVERWVDRIGSDPQAIIQVLDDTGQWQDPAPGTEPSPDDVYATAHWVAMGEEVRQRADDAGVVFGFGGDQQMQCEVVAP
jgi:hypothetical protein